MELRELLKRFPLLKDAWDALTVQRRHTQELVDRASAGERLDVSELRAANDKLEELKASFEAKRGEAERMQAAIDAGGMIDPQTMTQVRPGGAVPGAFASAIERGGWSRERTKVQVDFAAVRNSFSIGSDLPELDRTPVEAPPLGADRRFLYPSVPFEPVSAGATGVESFRQVSRTLADPGTMVRALGAVTTKPETSGVAEIVVDPLKQIATVMTTVPNVLLESSRVRSWIEYDLRLAWAEAVDGHVLGELATAAPPAGTAGANLLEAVINAAEAVASAGYAPRILAANPTDLIALMLLVQPGSGDYAGQVVDRLLSGLTKIAVKGLAAGAPYVLDPSALGTLYSSPIDVARFEEEAGQTNSSTVRCESNGLFVVQRIDAAAVVTVTP